MRPDAARSPFNPFQNATRLHAVGGPANHLNKCERAGSVPRKFGNWFRRFFYSTSNRLRFKLPCMVAVNSTMLPLGTKAPAFQLPDTTGKSVSLADLKNAPALVVVFMCNHCPYVKHVRGGLAQLARDYSSRGLAVVGISSNDVANYPADSPAKMAEEAKSAGYIFPYLYDETQEVAKDYRAACT